MYDGVLYRLGYCSPKEAFALTEKELRKLNRYQLLELLIEQTERADRLQRRLEQAEADSYKQSMHLLAMGSIAEASLQLNGVFEAAQKAADLYLEEAHKLAETIIADARAHAGRIRAGEEDPQENCHDI